MGPHEDLKKNSKVCSFQSTLKDSTMGPHEDLEKISNCLTAMPNETS